jgi:hypothetical protein
VLCDDANRPNNPSCLAAHAIQLPSSGAALQFRYNGFCLPQKEGFHWNVL